MGKGRNRAYLAIWLSILFVFAISIFPIASVLAVAEAKTKKEKDF